MNRHECDHNHEKKFTEAHDFDAEYSQKCGFGCGYTQANLIDELSKEISLLRADLSWCLNTIEVADEMMDDFDRDIDEGETIAEVKEIRERHKIFAPNEGVQHV